MLRWRNNVGFLISSSASLCLLAAAAAAPSTAVAEPNPDAASLQKALASPLNTLKDVQSGYAKVFGMVSELPDYGIPLRLKAASALEDIKSEVLQVQQSRKLSDADVQWPLVAIGEAQTALETDSAQTIAYSLQTVGQEIRDLGKKLSPETAQANLQRASATPVEAEPKQSSTQPTPEGMPQHAASEPQPQGQMQQPVAPQPKPQQVAANELKPQAQQQPAQPQAQPPQAAQANPSAANPPSPPQNSVAALQRSDIVGKDLYDSSGNEVAKIQDVKTSPDGKIAAVEIDLGGFLGIGARRIAVPVDKLQLQRGRIQSNSLSADQIRDLPQVAQ